MYRLSSRSFATTLLLISWLAVCTVPSHAEWIDQGIAVCRASYDQSFVRVAPDGAGGAYLVWLDKRSGSKDLYAQHVDALGNALWTTDGMTICKASHEQNSVRIVADGVGGAVIVWADERPADYKSDIYAQHVDATGAILWPSDGLAICTATDAQDWPEITMTDHARVIIAWQDQRNDHFDIYAQRLDASGNALWAPDGIAIADDSYSQSMPQIVSDDNGGAIISWEDARTSTTDIYAQQVEENGNLGWAAGGVSICSAADFQMNHRSAIDGNGGAIIAWEDRRGSYTTIYVQRVNAAGNVQWTTDGIALYTAGQWSGKNAQIIADGAGGAIITWQDYRNGDYDVYAQALDAQGTSLWTTNGAPVCTTSGYQENPQLSLDAMGNTFITWEDERSGSYDIYAQLVDTSGMPLWSANGVALCTRQNGQNRPQIITSETENAIVCWQDSRDSTTTAVDIYAQLVDDNGYWGDNSPVIAGIRDVPGDQGGFVNVAWDASRLDYGSEHSITSYTVWRAIASQSASALLASRASTVPGVLKEPVVRLEQVGDNFYYWELMASVDAYRLERYAKAVPTLFDSTSVSTEYHYFQVIAHTADPGMYWESAVDSCRSVDNLAPCTPSALTGQVETSPLALVLSWDPVDEFDFSGYAVYRGTSADFIPGSTNRLGTTSEPIFADEGWSMGAGYYYKVSARDIHENESGFATLAPDQATPVENPVLSHRNALYQNVPNPFNPRTRVIFETAREGEVTLRVYDTAGRLVRTLLSETMAAGRHEATWDGRDGQGRVAASGAYFVQLKTTGFTQSRKVLLSK